VQAFVPKEILIVDEALAVGDMFFQAKCMAQMKQLLDDGVTVLFVSHDTGAVKSLCRRALLLDHGQVIENSTADIVAEKYYSLKVRSEQTILNAPYTQGDALDHHGDTENLDKAFTPSADFLRRASFQRLQNGKAYFLNAQLLDQQGEELAQVTFDQEVTLRMAIQITADIPDRLEFGYHIRDANGVDLVYSDSIIEQAGIAAPRMGDRYVVDWAFKAALQAGNYTIAVGMSIPIDGQRLLIDRCDFIPLAIQFYVEPQRDSSLYGAVHWNNLVRIQRHSKNADV
jgi:lipopolysaccharide transport system ATP-binding protein